VTLELGGKSPQIIFDDADLDAALPMVINAIVQNAGPDLSPGSRLLVQQSIYEPLLERLGEAFENLRVGPAAMDLDVGPLIRASAAAARVGLPVGRAAGGHPDGGAGPGGGRGARVRLLPGAHAAARRAGHAPAGAGRSVRPGARAMSFRDEDQAVELANATQFGLVAGIWTRDGGRQLRMAKRVKSGQVFINNYGAGGGVELPSRREVLGLRPREGFRGAVRLHHAKTVAIKHG
jgi:aldehyde dehydrogenase (NAD+)